MRELHLATCDELGVEPAVKAEIVALLDNLQQLLIGIGIMQVRTVGWDAAVRGFRWLVGSWLGLARFQSPTAG